MTRQHPFLLSPVPVLSLAAFLILLIYVLLTSANSGAGFPLDDGWIHQTYARSLAQTGHWEYTPGVVSAGSTAPLWTLLLALGYLLRLPHLFWAYTLGAASLAWLALSGMVVWRHLWPAQAKVDWIAGLLLVTTWPFIWAAGSGMETLFFMALGMQLLAVYTHPTPQPAWKLGLLAGLLLLTRPDGLVLLLLVGGGLFLRSFWGWQKGDNSLGGAWHPLILFVICAAVPLIPYFLFNYNASGHIWPNTFYAKQTEYGILLAEPLWQRFPRLLFFSLGGPAEGWRGMSGAHLLLLPGLLYAGWLALQKDWQKRHLWALVPLLWAGGHVLLYAWRLPVTYQRGRYLWPALPIWILYGLAGWRLWLAGPRPARLPLGHLMHGRFWGRICTGTFIVVAAIFLLLGTGAYVEDVAVIQGEMVTMAHWINENTPADALIASHDIGAIGYFAQRPILDLAGLISPEVIPLLVDEEALCSYTLASTADYLVTAPGWAYRCITENEQALFLFQTDSPLTQAAGLNNMAVYQLVRER